MFRIAATIPQATIANIVPMDQEEMQRVERHTIAQEVMTHTEISPNVK